MKEETKYRMIECTRICTNINYCFLSYSKAIISKNRFVTHLRTTIIKLASVVKSLSYFRCVTSYVTNVNWFIIFRSFFEVKTDTVVVQIAHQLTVIQVLDAFFCHGMVYQTSFGKEVVVGIVLKSVLSLEILFTQEPGRRYFSFNPKK